MPRGIRTLYCEECNVGKRVKSSKKKYTWRTQLDALSHDIELYVSGWSGKVKVLVDGDIKLASRHKSGTAFSYPFKLGIHTLRIVQIGEAYDLRIDQHSFKSLYESRTEQELRRIDWETAASDQPEYDSEWLDIRRPATAPSGHVGGTEAKPRAVLGRALTDDGDLTAAKAESCKPRDVVSFDDWVSSPQPNPSGTAPRQSQTGLEPKNKDTPAQEHPTDLPITASFPELGLIQIEPRPPEKSYPIDIFNIAPARPLTSQTSAEVSSESQCSLQRADLNPASPQSSQQRTYAGGISNLPQCDLSGKSQSEARALNPFETRTQAQDCFSSLMDLDNLSPGDRSAVKPTEPNKPVYSGDELPYVLENGWQTDAPRTLSMSAPMTRNPFLSQPVMPPSGTHVMPPMMCPGMPPMMTPMMPMMTVTPPMMPPIMTPMMNYMTSPMTSPMMTTPMMNAMMSQQLASMMLSQMNSQPHH
jgi:hypothetical protein